MPDFDNIEAEKISRENTPKSVYPDATPEVQNSFAEFAELEKENYGTDDRYEYLPERLLTIRSATDGEVVRIYHSKVTGGQSDFEIEACASFYKERTEDLYWDGEDSQDYLLITDSNGGGVTVESVYSTRNILCDYNLEGNLNRFVFGVKEEFGEFTNSELSLTLEKEDFERIIQEEQKIKIERAEGVVYEIEPGEESININRFQNEIFMDEMNIPRAIDDRNVIRRTIFAPETLTHPDNKLSYLDDSWRGVDPLNLLGISWIKKNRDLNSGIQIDNSQYDSDDSEDSETPLR